MFTLFDNSFSMTFKDGIEVSVFVNDKHGTLTNTVEVAVRFKGKLINASQFVYKDEEAWEAAYDDYINLNLDEFIEFLNIIKNIDIKDIIIKSVRDIIREEDDDIYP